MKGDFTRWTFDASKRYSSVRLQQGRVLLDADWNEQLDIISYREQIANKEIIGLNGVPDLSSFAVGFEDQNISLDQGRCYVEGVLCENLEQDYQLEITEVPGILEQNQGTANPGDYLVYLEVWQHHITAIEEPELREPALGGPDTTTRTQTYWRLKAAKLTDNTKWREEWEALLSEKGEKGKLKVESGTALPNDLYRVEIHEVGEELENTTFKWARNNASMAARVAKIEPYKITIIKNNQIQFQQEQGKEWWIEITDEDHVKACEPGVFLKVDHVEEDNQVLIINDDNWPEEIEELDPGNKITTVRIWEADARTINFTDSETSENLIELEKGLKVNFVDRNYYTKYRTGDYWLIPTRSHQEVVWATDGKVPDGIQYYYCPLTIINYEDLDKWSVVQDCREVFPALTEMARETAVTDDSGKTTGKGRKLSIGVHSYNDARRANQTTQHQDDCLDIQGGKQLTLNAGYWKDKLETQAPDPVAQAISFSICEQEVMRLSKDDLSIIGDKNLVVEGTSWLKGVVSIGTEPPNETIGLLVQPDLSTGIFDEVVGEKLVPKLTASADGKTLTALHIQPNFNNAGYTSVARYGLIVEEGKVSIGADRTEMNPLQIGVDLRPEVKAQNHKDKLAALYINPNFQNNGQSPVYRFGLIVEEGKIGIGSKTRTRDEELDKHRIGVDVRPEVDARDAQDKLVGLYINPDFKDTCSCGITEAAQYGLIVEGGRVAFGPKLDVNGTQEYLVDIGTDGDVKRLKVAGDLEVYGKVTYHAEKGEPGNVELGQQNEDKLLIHGKLETEHTSGKLKVTSPLEVQLEGNNTQDFLSLFAANDTEDVNGRIVWKKGTVTDPGDPYTEEAKEVAAIYSTTTGDGTNSSTGDLRFGTSPSTEDQILDRMVITADGNVGIGTDNPGSELEVTGTTDLETLVVQKGLTVQGDEDHPYTTMVKLNLEGLSGETQDEKEEHPTLTVSNGGVCIGADRIPEDDAKRDADVDEIKLYVDGKVTFAQDLSVLGKTKVKTLSATPELRATRDGDTLVAVEIKPRFDDTIPELKKIPKKGKANFQAVKKLALRVESGDVVLSSGALQVESGKLVLGQVSVPTNDKLRVTGGATLLEGNLQVGKDSIALKVNQAAQEVGIGGDSQSSYKLAVTGNTKLTGKLEVVPQNLNGASRAVEIKPAFTGTGNQTAVLIEPTFAGNGNAKFGLRVVRENVALCSQSGGVAIGSQDPGGHKLKVTGGTTHLDGALTVASGGVTLTQGNVTLTQGNVAIGSDAPEGHKLKVTGGTTHLDGALTVASGGVALTSGNVTLTSGNVALTSGNVALTQGNVTLTSGNVTLTQGNLQVTSGAIMTAAGDTEQSGILFPKNPGGGGGDAAWIRYYVRGDSGEATTFEIGTSDNPDDHIVLKTAGAVGIGKVPGETGTDEMVKLDVNGKVHANDALLTSDAILKENIQTLKDGLGKILGLRGVSYQWKDNEKAAQEAQIGLVAQEVEAIFPELVNTDSQGMKSLSYSKLIAPLIEAVKDQQRQISELVKQVKELQAPKNR